MRTLIFLVMTFCFFQAHAGPIRQYEYLPFWKIPKGTMVHIKIENPQGENPISFQGGKLTYNLNRRNGGYCSLYTHKTEYSIDVTVPIGLGGYPFYACPYDRLNANGSCPVDPISVADIFLDGFGKIICNSWTVYNMLAEFNGAIE